MHRNQAAAHPGSPLVARDRRAVLTLVVAPIRGEVGSEFGLLGTFVRVHRRCKHVPTASSSSTVPGKGLGEQLVDEHIGRHKEMITV